MRQPNGDDATVLVMFATRRIVRMKNLSRALVGLIFVHCLGACGGGAAAAVQPAVPLPAVAWAPAVTLDALIARNDADNSSPLSGFVLLVHNGQALYGRGFGKVDRHRALVPNLDTTFRIGSVTKTFTSAAIMLLIRDGRLALNQKLGTLPLKVPAIFANVTIAQLLSHTSGIADFTDRSDYETFKNQNFSSVKLLDLIWQGGADFSPGEKFQYSNSGYVVLGVIIEKITHRPFADFFNTRLFAPAGMTRTFVGEGGGPNMANGYVADEDADAISMTVPHAAGSIRSTARDLSAWHTLLQGNFFTPAEKTLLYTPVQANYGFGWIRTALVDGKYCIGHGGGIDGFVTSFMRLSDDDVVAIVLSNDMSNAPEVVGRALLLAYLGHAPVIEAVVLPSAYNFEKAKLLAGVYAMTAESTRQLADLPSSVLASIATITVSAYPDGLGFEPVGQPAQRLLAYGDGSYRLRTLNLVVTFDKLPSGVTATPTFTVVQNETTIHYQRM